MDQASDPETPGFSRRNGSGRGLVLGVAVPVRLAEAQAAAAGSRVVSIPFSTTGGLTTVPPVRR